MWKDTYKTGVERIDFQHKALFDKTQELLEAIESEATAHTYREILSFLKAYVVSHFRDEEAYQRSIQYADLESHKKAHQNFTKVVLAYEAKLEQTDFDIAVVKDLAGTLTAWLTYHVVNSDLKMVRGHSMGIDGSELSPLETFLTGFSDTVQYIAGLQPEQIRQYDAAAANQKYLLDVDIEVFGDINGVLTYSFSREIALGLFEAMTQRRPENIDVLVCSALLEITNISTGNATIALARKGVTCDIKPPAYSMEERAAVAFEGMVIDSPLGKMKLAVNLQ